MNSPYVIDTFETKTFYKNLTDKNDTKWFENIFYDWQPDEIILKNISVYDSDPAEAGEKTKMIFLKTNLLDYDQVLATYPLCVAYHETYHVPFKNTKKINGTYYFKLEDINGANLVTSGTYNTTISITLMFVKYKSSTTK